MPCDKLLALPETQDQLIRHYRFNETDLSIIRCDAAITTVSALRCSYAIYAIRVSRCRTTRSRPRRAQGRRPDIVVEEAYRSATPPLLHAAGMTIVHEQPKN